MMTLMGLARLTEARLARTVTINAEWRHYPDACYECGDDLEVFTESEQEGFVFDNDPIRCVACGATGIMDVWDDDDVRIQWHENTEATNG